MPASHDKALTYAFQHWKGKASGLRNRLVVNTQGAVRLVKDRLRQALLAYQSTQKQGLFSAFSKWKFQSFLRRSKAAFDRKREDRIQVQRKELRDCELEIDRLTAQQPELEQRMSDLMLNEKTYKDTITRLRGERDAVGASRAQLEAESKEQSRAQEVRLERRLEDLERENQELQEKMTALENNVVFFIKEMSGLIDFQENLRADKDSPMHRGSRPTDKKPDRSKQYAGARNLNLEF